MGNAVRNSAGNLVGNSAENLAGDAAGISAGQCGEEKAYLRKAAKFSIWNRVIGSQPITSSLGNLVGNLARNLAGNLVGNLAGNAVGNSAGQGGWEKAYLRKAVICGNLAFGIG